jgi:hypothetical protein
MVCLKIRRTLSASIVGTRHNRTYPLIKFTGTRQLSHITVLGPRTRKSHLCFSYMYRFRAGNIVTLPSVPDMFIPTLFCPFFFLLCFVTCNHQTGINMDLHVASNPPFLS